MTNLKARPTIYKGTRMRSRLEASFAQCLDLIGLEWTYEPECFASEAGQYLPDFLVTDWPSSLTPGLDAYSFDDQAYVEVKPHLGNVLGAMAAMNIIRHGSDRSPYRYRALAVVVPYGTWPDIRFSVAAHRPPKDDWDVRYGPLTEAELLSIR